MTLYKRGSIWWAYVFIDGVRHAKSTGTVNRRHAQSIGHAFEEELNLRRHQMPKLKPEMTVDELTALFISEGLAKTYALDRLKHTLPFFGTMRLADIDKAFVRTYRKERHEASTIKPATVNRDLSVLRRVLYFAVEEGYITANPLARMQMERERRTKRPVLSIREELILLPSASPHLRRIVICALDTGMRRGEILAQLWEDVDFDHRILYVSHSKTPEGEMREIPLTRRLCDLLISIRQERGPVFTFRDEPLTEIKRAWKAGLRRGSLRHIRFHDLRHTANTRLTLAGVMQEVRRELMGHTLGKSRDVNDRYTSIQLPEKRDAIRKLESGTTHRSPSLPNQNPLLRTSKSPNQQHSPKGGFMTADKKQPAGTQPSTAAAHSSAEATTRKAWTPKSPVEVVLEQIGKQEKRVAALQKELDQEKALLGKLAKAKAALEA